VLRSKAAGLTRWGRHEDAARARRDLCAALLEDTIADALAKHVFTSDQRERFAALFRSPEADHDHNDDGRALCQDPAVSTPHEAPAPRIPR